ncbi:MAG: hypothetical protein U5L05_13040 [Rubrivivax sp.]|nr:hypothetical protein [Rubrivivax sp.]
MGSPEASHGFTGSRTGSRPGEHIDPALNAAGWGVVEGSRVLREHGITLGRLQGGGQRAKAEIADYVLVYRNTKLAVIEAKAWGRPHTEGVGQARLHKCRLHLRHQRPGDLRHRHGHRRRRHVPLPPDALGRDREAAWRDGV